MWSGAWSSVLVLLATAATASALPAVATGTDQETAGTSQGTLAAEERTLKDSEPKLLTLSDLEDGEGLNANKVNFLEDDRAKRMLDFVQTALLSIFQPKPIIDTITEEEKYGNTGDTLGALGRGIVGGSEAISNFINLAIEYPKNMFKSLVHRATEALNHFGSKLVGL